MKYDLFKDAASENTLTRIKTILSDIDINITENIIERKISKNTSIVSVNLSFPDLTDGIMTPVSGKGTNITNALVSAYAEFIERTSNKIIFHKRIWQNFGYFPDEQICSINEITKNIINKYYKNKNDIYEFEKLFTENDKSYLAPFYNIKDNKIHYLPVKTLLFTQVSNGMAAGNTFEEAIIQGLSEIFERFAIKEIFAKKISIPQIPKKYYMKYTIIKEIIDYYKKLGFIIKIKDASLGKKLPVVCVQLEDNKNETIQLSFGAHPSLPVAIERALVEIIQCRDFDIEQKELFKSDKRFFSAKYFKYLMNKNSTYISTACQRKKLVFEKNQFLYELFCCNLPNYDFTESNWINLNNNDNNNKTLLKFIINNTKLITKNDIYIRNSSFLGFPSVCIYIPKVSTIFEYDRRKGNNLKNLHKICYGDTNYSVSEILSAAEYITKNRHNCTYHLTYWLPEEYIGFLCAIVLKDKKKIINFADILLTHKIFYEKFTQESIFLFKMIKNYYENEKSLFVNYTKPDITKLHNFINNLDCDVIKTILQKERNLEGMDDLYASLKQDNLKIRKIFTPVFEENIPNQRIFKKIFEN